MFVTHPAKFPSQKAVHWKSHALREINVEAWAEVGDGRKLIWNWNWNWNGIARDEESQEAEERKKKIWRRARRRRDGEEVLTEKIEDWEWGGGTCDGNVSSFLRGWWWSVGWVLWRGGLRTGKVWNQGESIPSVMKIYTLFLQHVSQVVHLTCLDAHVTSHFRYLSWLTGTEMFQIPCPVLMNRPQFAVVRFSIRDMKITSHVTTSDLKTSICYVRRTSHITNLTEDIPSVEISPREYLLSLEGYFILSSITRQ
jgi:hypothetical protein